MNSVCLFFAIYLIDCYQDMKGADTETANLKALNEITTTTVHWPIQ